MICHKSKTKLLPNFFVFLGSDRKKDLVKLQTGEYISLATIETVLKKSPFVENICVYADGDFDYCTALIVPYRKNLEVCSYYLQESWLPAKMPFLMYNL